MKKGFSGEANVPYYRGTDVQEAAKFMRLQASRFLADRVTAHDLDEAVASWVSARQAVMRQQGAL